MQTKKVETTQGAKGRLSKVRKREAFHLAVGSCSAIAVAVAATVAVDIGIAVIIIVT